MLIIFTSYLQGYPVRASIVYAKLYNISYIYLVGLPSSAFAALFLAFVLFHARNTAEPIINAQPSSDTACGMVWNTMPSRVKAKTIWVYTMLTATKDFSACRDRVMRNCYREILVGITLMPQVNCGVVCNTLWYSRSRPRP